MLPVAVAQSSSKGNAKSYVLPVLCMTSRSNTMESELARIKDDTYISSSSQGGGTSRTSDNVVWSNSPRGGTGAKSAVSDYVSSQTFLA